MTQGSLAPAESPALSAGPLSGPQPANLGDILERVLDKGIVIAGDIRVNLLDIELLTIKLRLVIASLDTARQVGINWWESDPWLNAQAANGDRGRELEEENRKLRRRVKALESGGGRDD
jgi:Gas vesicle protein